MEERHTHIFLYGIITTLLVHTVSATEWTLISQTRTTFLEMYRNYIDAVVMHFDVPEDSTEAMFELRASMRQSSPFFKCEIKDVAIHLQYGAPPVINPDGSRFPHDFLLDRRESIANLSFSTDKSYQHINITAPIPGSYYAAAFHPYINPKDQGITQDGLFPVCNSFIDASLYVKQLNVTPILSDQTFPVGVKPRDTKLFKLYIPSNIFKVILVVSDLQLCDACKEIAFSVYPSSTSKGTQSAIVNGTSAISSFRVLGDDDYYIRMVSNVTTTKNDETVMNFNVKFVETLDDDVAGNASYLNASRMYYSESSASVAWKYDEYELHKSLNTESFQFTYELEQLQDGSVPINVSISNVGFAALKFNVRDVLDVGGTINVVLSFLPKLEKKGRWLYVKDEPKNHTVVACIRRAGIEVPMWENNCKYLDVVTQSPLILNSTVKNATFLIPYPEPGNWYLTFKLFCGSCEPCDCPQSCKDTLQECLMKCESDCVDDCYECQGKCERRSIYGKSDCMGCDCDSNCRTQHGECNSSVLFDISSYPCVGDECGSNGKCAFGVAEGFVYSTCVCTNHYKGWDCLDDSNANSLFKIWLELLLLVFSNFAFAIAVVVAFRRRFYVEALVYASILFSSTFYHACDAGEHRINFCLVALNVLQFCDFYCAILSIWVTLIAMAYLPSPMPHLLHIGGAIFLGAAVTLNKTSLWVFVVPVTLGFVIVFGSWGLRYYKTRKVFPSKRYLILYFPLGIAVALIALLAFAIFQTQSNYKYVHSLWHIMMAVAVVILLPNMDMFLPSQ